MKEKILDNKDILELSTRQEGHFYDKKAKLIEGKKIQNISVAFANADGGDFIVGIKDEKDEPDAEKRWDGDISKEYFNKVFQSIMEIKPSIPYTPTFLINPVDKTSLVSKINS
jgi:ATP-dependent DNA helicase RecG